MNLTKRTLGNAVCDSRLTHHLTTSLARCGFRELFDTEWLACCTNTQPQLICQDVRGLITFSQQEDFYGAINDLLSRYNGNKQIDRSYDLL